MDSRDRKWFTLLGLAALIAWPIYWLWRLFSKDE